MVIEQPAAYDPGSFRDRHARVFHADGRIFRALDAHAAAEWRTLRQKRFFARLLSDGMISPTQELQSADIPSPLTGPRWSTVLTHERIPFVSYPYEWSFGMLKDAALLHLEIMALALDEQMILKDSSPYNYQWLGTRPQLIDITSLASLAHGDPWIGYRQFCRLFLYPLLLEAYKGVAFQPWLRGSIEGIDAEACWGVMSLHDLLRPGVLQHVYLQSRFERTYASTPRDLRSDLRSAGFHAGLLKANVERLKRLIAGLHSPRHTSTWSEYGRDCHYDQRDDRSKVAFVERAVSTRNWRLTWDLGANTGRYSRIAAVSSQYVVGLDADAVSIDRMYASLRAERSAAVLPLVCNIAEPSPGLGWRNRERRVLTDRGIPDLTLCLALVHHLVIDAGIPLPDLIDWLSSLGSSLVIEFATREDPMVERLLRHKEDAYYDYDLQGFEDGLSAAFNVTERLALESGTRILYFAEVQG